MSFLSKQSVLFLVSAPQWVGEPFETDPEYAWNLVHQAASTRIQLGPARQVATDLGCKTNALALTSEYPECIEKIENQHCCIFGKIANQDRNTCKKLILANLAAIPILKSQSAHIAVVYSDNLCVYKDHPVATLYNVLLRSADSIIYPSLAMQKIGRRFYSKTMKPKEWIIEDLCQMNRYNFSVLQERKPCRLIWFGHPSNARFLLQEIPRLAGFCSGWDCFELTVLSDANTCLEVSQEFSKVHQKKPWTIRQVVWDFDDQPGQLDVELKRAHIAILPSDADDPRKSAASHNRAVDAIQAGCMTIASPIDSYLELKKLLLVTTDFAKTIDSGLAHYDRLTEKWPLHRSEALHRFSKDENSRKWREFFEFALNC